MFDNQELHKLVIISLILITFMWDSVSDTVRRNQRLVFVKDERVEREQDKFTTIMERVCRLFLSKNNFIFFYLLV